MAKNNIKKVQRFKGCMLGLAAGDALGAPLKSLKRDEIKKKYGKKGLLNPKPEKGSKTVKITDETQLMLFTAHGMLWGDTAGSTADNPTQFTQYIYYALQQWLFSQTGETADGMDWITDDNETGYPCELLNIDELCKKRMPTKQLLAALTENGKNEYGLTTRKINENALFDCVPRVAPAGMYFYNSPETAFKTGMEFAAITHSEPSAYLSAGCFAAIIAFILKKNTIEESVRKAMELLSDYEECDSVYKLLENALELLEGTASPLNDIKELGGGSTAESALATGVYCACVHYEADNAIRLAANNDGNSDAVAAITGALKGAYLGDKSIPKKWVKKIQLTDIVTEYAEKLYEAAPKKNKAS